METLLHIHTPTDTTTHKVKKNWGEKLSEKITTTIITTSDDNWEAFQAMSFYVV